MGRCDPQEQTRTAVTRYENSFSTQNGYLGRVADCAVRCARRLVFTGYAPGQCDQHGARIFPLARVLLHHLARTHHRSQRRTRLKHRVWSSTLATHHHHFACTISVLGLHRSIGICRCLKCAHADRDQSTGQTELGAGHRVYGHHGRLGELAVRPCSWTTLSSLADA